MIYFSLEVQNRTDNVLNDCLNDNGTSLTRIIFEVINISIERLFSLKSLLPKKSNSHSLTVMALWLYGSASHVSSVAPHCSQLVGRSSAGCAYAACACAIV